MDTKFKRFQHDLRLFHSQVICVVLRSFFPPDSPFSFVSFHKISPITFAYMWSNLSETVLTNRSDYFTLHTYRVSFCISFLSLFFAVVKMPGSVSLVESKSWKPFQNQVMKENHRRNKIRNFSSFFVCKFKLSSNLYGNKYSMLYTWLTPEITQICV